MATSISLAAVFGITMLMTTPSTPPMPQIISQAVDQVDVASLISAHANYIAGKKLADGSGNRIIRSDLASQSSGDPGVVPADPLLAESASYTTAD